METTSADEAKRRIESVGDDSTTSQRGDLSKLPSKRPRVPETPRAKAVREKLEGIIIPRISLDDTTAEEAIDFLSLRIMELDPEPNGGLSFRIKRPNLPDLPQGGHADIDYIGHDFRADNLSAWKILKRIASDNGMRVEVTDHGVLLTSREADMNPLENDR